MSSSKKVHELSKAVLNISTLKGPDGEYLDIPRTYSIDITDFLKKNGINTICKISGITALEEGPITAEGGDIVAQYVLTSEEANCLEKSVEDIVDAAVVNEKQCKAVKKLISEAFSDTLHDGTESIKSCDIVKSHYDKIFDEVLHEK